MKLSEALEGVGYPVSYYPGIRKLCGSTTATLLFCQLFYWKGREANKDGWLYKDSDELERETGLSYKEQKAARRQLVKNKLLEEDYDRLSHRMYFRIMVNSLNDQWEVPESTNGKFGKVPTVSSSYAETTTEITTKKKKNSFFRESDKSRWEGLQTGTGYAPDGYPPNVKLAEKKKMEKALGLSPTPPKVKFMFFSGGKFLEKYESLFGIPWEGKGILQLDPVAKTLSEWYDRGMREDGAAALVIQYFKSKKAREGTITPTACFSEHTWQAYRQNKLK